MKADDSPNDAKLAQELRRFLRSVEAGGQAILPQSNDVLLASIVEAAARIFGAAAASILLVDEQQQMLVFKVTYGAGDHSLIGMRFPLDQGIAGYVAMTGQPIAISDVQQDARFNQDFAKKTGYVPRSILAMPLLSGERVIGVMEVLDKINAPSFGMQDMELLAMFARQAAMAIDQSQQMEQIGATLLRGLKRLVDGEGEAAGELAGVLAEVGEGSGQSPDILALADLFNQISALGPAERKACLQIMSTFAEYSRSRSSYELL